MRYDFHSVRIMSAYPTTKKVEQRALSLNRRFKKDEAFWKDYIGFMKDVLVKGHADRVPEEQLLWHDGILWYIRHHGIYHKIKRWSLTVRLHFQVLL